MEKERELYIKDMCFYVLRKWRKILIWMIVFAIIADGFSALKSYKNVIESQQMKNVAEEELKEAKAALSEGDAKIVERSYESYVTYKESLDSSINYYNNSIKMQMDPNQVSTIDVQYSVNNSKILQDIVEAYSNAVLSEESCEYISQKAGLDSNVKYVNELIEMYVTTEEDEKITIVDNDDSKSMLINIIAPNKETCEKLADAVEEKIQEYTPKIQESFGNFKIEKIDRNYTNGFNNDLLEEQQTFMMNLGAINSAISSLSTVMPEGQKKYYSALISYNDDETKNEDVTTAVTFQPISIKFIIVGLFAGAFLAVCWYIFIYVIDRYLKNEDEVEDYLEVPVLGTIPSEKTIRLKNNLIDRTIYKIFKKGNNLSEEENIQLICSNILLYAKMKNINNILITSVVDSEFIEKIKKQIGDSVQKEETEFKCTVGKSIIQNVESLNALASSDGVIFVEEVGNSDFEDMGKEVSICLKNNMTIIGAVVVD